MFKFKYLLAIVAAFFAFASCGDDTEEAEQPPPGPVATEITITGIISPLKDTPAGSRVSLSDLNLAWEAGDQVAVYYYPVLDGTTYVTNTKFTLSSGAGSATGEFSSDSGIKWVAAAEKHTFYTVYPYSEGVDLEAIPLTIPVVQPQGGSLISNGVLTGKVDYDSVRENIEMEFVYPMAMLDIVVSGGDSQLASQQIRGFELSADAPFAGTAFYNAIEGSIGQGDASVVTVQYDNDLRVADGFSATVHILPSNLTEGSLYLKIFTDEYIASYEIDGSIVFLPGYRYALNVDMAALETSGKGSVGKISPDANSFMLRPGGEVNIPVRRAYTVWEDHLDTPLEGEPEARFIWTDNPSLVSSYGILKGRDDISSVLSVKTASGEEGNAVIGIAVDGELRWSWHIWVSAEDPTATKHTLNGYVFMDRNLGALNATPGDPGAFGFYYQWGRKDPFPSSSSATEKIDLTIYDGEGNEIGIMDEMNEGYTLDFAIRNPLSYMYTDGTGPGIWTGSNGTESWDLDGGKTVFDPCPEGWRVPAWKNGKSPWDGYDRNNTTYDETNKGRVIEGNMWYPFNGYMLYADRTEGYHCWSVGQSGSLWTASPHDTIEDYAYRINYGSGLFGATYGGQFHYGYAVRCVQE